MLINMLILLVLVAGNLRAGEKYFINGSYGITCQKTHQKKIFSKTKFLNLIYCSKNSNKLAYVNYFLSNKESKSMYFLRGQVLNSKKKNYTSMRGEQIRLEFPYYVSYPHQRFYATLSIGPKKNRKSYEFSCRLNWNRKAQKSSMRKLGFMGLIPITKIY